MCAYGLASCLLVIMLHEHILALYILDALQAFRLIQRKPQTALRHSAPNTVHDNP